MYRSVLLLAFPLLAALATGKDKEEQNIRAEEVTYRSDTVTMKGYLAYDANLKGKRPGILIVHEWWGYNEYTKSRARQLAGLGYIALALDMYGDGKVALNPADAQKFAGAAMANIEQARGRFVAALNVLKSNNLTDTSRIAAIGYCFGGGVVLNMARMGVPLNGVVSFHGGLGRAQIDKPDNIRGSILVCNGGADKFVSPEAIEAFKKEMADAKVDFAFKSYPDALHAFTNPEATANGKKFNMPIAYNEAADKNSWSDMKEFFNKIFAK